MGYSLQARAKGYDGPRAVAFARGAASPLLAVQGRIAQPDKLPVIVVDPSRAVATCLKPADGDATSGLILRLGEVAGKSGPIEIAVAGCRKVVQTDLLERDRDELKISDGRVAIGLKPHGFCALRLLLSE